MSTATAIENKVVNATETKTALKDLGVHDFGHGIKQHVYEDANGERSYVLEIPEKTAIEKEQEKLNETAKAENAVFLSEHIKTAKLNGLSYVVSRPNCYKVSYKVVEAPHLPEKMRTVTNKTLSRFVKFTDIWETGDTILNPVWQALELLPSADSKTAVKAAVWPIAKACGRAVPGSALLELLTSLRKYRQVSAKGIKMNVYENVRNDIETVLIQFLNTCPKLETK